MGTIDIRYGPLDVIEVLQPEGPQGRPMDHSGNWGSGDFRFGVFQVRGLQQFECWNMVKNMIEKASFWPITSLRYFSKTGDISEIDPQNIASFWTMTMAVYFSVLTSQYNMALKRQPFFKSLSQAKRTWTGWYLRGLGMPWKATGCGFHYGFRHVWPIVVAKHNGHTYLLSVKCAQKMNIELNYWWKWKPILIGPL